MKTIAVTGANGLIGTKLVLRGCIPIYSDILDVASLNIEIAKILPDVVIHCAAITDVPYCEEHFQESFDVNVRGTMNVVNAMPKNAILIYLSTDHVFSGRQYFYEGYGEWHKPSPVNRYGFSKWGGEEMAKTFTGKNIIVRSSKIFNYAWASPILDRLKNGQDVEVTDVIKRSFIHSDHFVDNLLHLIYYYKELPEIDIINLSGSDVFSYYMFWTIVQRELELPGKLMPRRYELKDECPRPLRGGLNISQSRKLGFPVYSISDGAKLLGQGI